jgi:putative hydrolase of the HAD superfamily
MLKAVIFDLFKTLGEFKGAVSDQDICIYLQKRGYEIFPQTFKYAFSFVTFIDNPKTGFTNYEDMFRKTFERIGITVDEETIEGVSKIYRDNPFQLYSGSVEAVLKVKKLGLKTAIVTTPPKFWFDSGIKPIHEYIDFICTSSEACCEKSNPKIYRKALEVLGVSASETVVIGDNSEVDVRIPKQLGMYTIHLTEEESYEANATAENLLSAVDVVKRWLN